MNRFFGKQVFRRWGVALLLASAGLAHAAADEHRSLFAGIDLSGTYRCDGHDLHDKKFYGSMTLELDLKNSSGNYGAYRALFITQTDIYTGAMVVDDSHLAMQFANQDLSKRNFGVALGTVTGKGDTMVRFDKFYFQPEYKGGGNGYEVCLLQDS